MKITTHALLTVFTLAILSIVYCSAHLDLTQRDLRQSHKRKRGISSSSDADQKTTLGITLVGERYDGLDSKMQSIALARGAWLSTEELAYYTTPSNKTRYKVEEFLQNKGIEPSAFEYNSLGNSLTVTTDASTLSKAFGLTASANKRGKRHIAGTNLLEMDHVKVPSSLAAHVVNIRDMTKSAKNTRHILKKSGKSSHKTRHHKLTHKTSKSKSKSKTTKVKHPIHSETITANRIAHHTTRSTKVKTSTKSTKRIHSSTSAIASTTPASSPSSQTNLAACQNNNVTFPCMAKFYGYADYRAKAAKGSESVAAINYGEWLDSTIVSFERMNNIANSPNYIPNKRYLGSNTGAWQSVKKDNSEAALDVEMLIGVAYPLDISIFSSSLDLTQNVQALIDMADEDRPGVVSISYGYNEDDVSIEYFQEFCNAVQQLTALGTTFVTASGDYGVDGNGENGKTCPPFRVDFMSACPYVLSVGATTSFSQERAVYDPTQVDLYNGWSTGGFSNYAPTPTWQATHVQTYLNSINARYSQYYNTSGRGFPDVAAFGNYLPLSMGNKRYNGAGTSGSCPIVAGILALLNSKCKDAGRTRIGWVHPVLYSDSRATNDITKGGAYMCSDNSAYSAMGFPCKQGWDPVTGLGSLNFPGLVEAFQCG